MVLSPRVFLTTSALLLCLLATLCIGGPLMAHSTAAARQPAAATTAQMLDIGSFEATVYQGPDKGLSLPGELKLARGTSGRLTGMLTPTSGPSVKMTGQINGVAINLIFYLSGGKHIFGVGTFGRDPATGKPVMGGPLVGPQGGDSGDWDILQYGFCRLTGGSNAECIGALLL